MPYSGTRHLCVPLQPTKEKKQCFYKKEIITNRTVITFYKHYLINKNLKKIIKNLLYFYLTMLLLGTLGVSSCADNNELSSHEQLLLEGWLYNEQGDTYYRFPTEEEIKNSGREDELTLATEASVGPNVAVTRAVTCAWSDGVGGTMDCSGGSCNVVWQISNPTSVDGSTPAQVQDCISCSNGTVGLCRN